jgi:uncharacterized protein involved in exopolysaccharide biosynthesis
MNDGLVQDRREARGPDERVVDLAEMARFVRRHGLLVFGTATSAAIITVLVVFWVLPPTFEASATLIVVPPTYSSELKPPALSVQGYDRLLKSDVVIAETNRRLIERGILKEDHALAVGDELETRIFVSRRAEETSLAPIIEATGRTSSASGAAAMANVWAETFLTHSRKLLAGSTLPTVEFIEQQYKEHDEHLKSLGEERASTANDYQERLDRLRGEWDLRIDEASGRWDRDLVDLKKSTEDGVASYQIDTRKVIESSAGARYGPPRRAAAVAPTDAPSSSPSGAEPDLRAKIRQLVAGRVQLAQTPQFLLVEKAVNDDALWQAMTLSQSSPFELQQLIGRSLVSQEVNPVHNDLALRVADLEQQIESAPTVDETVAALVASLEKLQRERSSGLAKLLADRGIGLDAKRREKVLGLAELQRQQDRAILSLQRERDLALDALDRQLFHAKAIFDDLAKNHNQAVLARAQQDLGDVRLGSPAEPPLQPASRHLVLRVGLAALMGALAGVVVAAVKSAEAS